MNKLIEQRIYEFERFRLDAAHSMLYRNEQEISLPPKAVETLLALIERNGEIVGKEELMRIIWPDSCVEESNLAQYLHVLRKTLGERSDTKPFIETLRRRGYRFSADVSWVGSEDDNSRAILAVSSLIGRENETDEVARLLQRDDVRLVTLTGVGGVGKTTVARSAAHRIRNDFADGVFFVELAAVTNHELVIPAIATSLGLKEAGERPIADALKEYLHKLRALLILDNFEQIVSAAPAIAELIKAAQNLKILVTSRVHLHVSAEYEILVPPLSAPSEIVHQKIQSDAADGNMPFDSLEPFLAYEAVRLFIVRAQRAKPGFELTLENAGCVAEICSRLDGLPLAIELAAARSRLMSPQAILARMESQLGLLTGGDRDLPARQQTMRNTVEWSYNLLENDERLLLRRLSVFAGSFNLEAAEAISSWQLAESSREQLLDNGIEQKSLPNDSQSLPTANRQLPTDFDVLDGISSLIEKGLLISNELPDGDLRFRMLEVVREYAREALEANGELDATSRRHAVYFVALGVRAEPHLEAAQSAEWLNRLESEHANLRVALSWAIDNDVNLGQRLAGAIWRFWWLHGHIREACDWIEAFLSQRADADAPARTKMLLGAGFLNRLRRNFEMAGRFAQEGLALSEKTGDKRSSAFALYQLALLALDNKDMRLAGSLFEKGLDFAHDSGNMQILALLLNGLGELSRSQANYAKAAEFYRQALLINREVGDLTRQVTNLINLGATAIAQNDQKSAGEFYRAGLEIGSKMKDMNGSLYCLEGVAGAIWASCDAKRAARLLGAADALRSTNNLFLEPADRIPYEQSVSLVRTSLDKKVFADYFSKGSKMKLEDAVELALAESTIGQPKAERLAMLYF